MSGNFLTGNPRCPICSGHHPINAPCFLSTNWIPLEKTPMTTDIKELVRGRELRATLAERDDLMRRLRGQHRAIRSGYLKGLFLAAADALEAMAGEVERLKLANIHPLIMRAEKAEAENARLEGALEALAGERDAWEKAAREHLDWRERNRERANAAEAERDRLKAALDIAKAHAKQNQRARDLVSPYPNDHAKRIVWEKALYHEGKDLWDKLRKALGGDAS